MFDKLIQKALYQQKMKKFSQAREIYKRILKKDSNHLNANYLLGTLYFEMGKLKEAEHYLNRAVQIDPYSPSVLNNLGNLYKLQKNILKAEECYVKALRFKPDFASALFNLGSILEGKGENTKIVLDLYLKALSIDPQLPELHWKIANILFRQNTPKALDYYENAVRLNPGLINIRGDYGYALLKFGYREAAIEQFRSALKSNPNDVKSKYFLAIAEKREPDPELREKYIQENFDAFSDFENILVEDLEYKIPFIVRELLEMHFGSQMLYNNVADLGCGTGLSGVEFRRYAKNLIGIDISETMLKLADEKKCYDMLYHGEIVNILDGLDSSFDLFAATDVFVYVGDLELMFKSIIKKAAPNAILVFSTEHIDGKGFSLLESGRYAHSEDYINNISITHDFRIIDKKTVPGRREGDVMIMKDIYILQRK